MFHPQRWMATPTLSPQCPAQRRLGLVHRTQAKATHQVHDKVQLDGKVHDEEDAGPGVLGVGGHHHIWEAVFAECYLQGPCLPVSAFSKDVPLSAFPAPSALPHSQLTRPLPSLMGALSTCLSQDVEHPWLKRGKKPGPYQRAGRSQSRAQTYLAVVRRTNRLMMLFSRVLKYCGDRRARGHVGARPRAHTTGNRPRAVGHLQSPVLPHPTLHSSRGIP